MTTFAERPIRVLAAKPGLDAHDKGVKVVVQALRDAGMEVIYTGLRATMEQIVTTAVEEDVDVVGISLLSGSHLPVCRKVVSALRAAGREDVLVVVGGVIPEKDREPLHEAGVHGVFPVHSRFEEIVAFIRREVAERRAAKGGVAG